MIQKKQLAKAVKKIGSNSKYMQLSAKRRGFIHDHIVEGETQKQAYKNNFPTENELTAATNSTRLMRNPEIQDAIREIYEAAGVNTHMIAKVHADAMGATKQFWDSKEGKIVETVLPDHSIRLKAAKQAADILKDEVDKETAVKNQTLNVNIIASEKMEEDFSEFLKDKYKRKKITA